MQVQAAETPGQQQEPPEEDVSEAKKEYALNPLQAEKEFKIGSFYMKKGSYRAAARRFEEALKWDPNMAEAWLKIAEAQTKLKNTAAAKAAYKQYLELRPDAKDAAEIRKKLK
jgi:tetratricopeptide (TPR) repeat protein